MTPSPPFIVVGYHSESDSIWQEGPQFEFYEAAVLHLSSVPDGDGLEVYYICSKVNKVWLECHRNLANGSLVFGTRTFKIG